MRLFHRVHLLKIPFSKVWTLVVMVTWVIMTATGFEYLDNFRMLESSITCSKVSSGLSGFVSLKHWISGFRNLLLCAEDLFFFQSYGRVSVKNFRSYKGIPRHPLLWRNHHGTWHPTLSMGIAEE